MFRWVVAMALWGAVLMPARAEEVQHADGGGIPAVCGEAVLDAYELAKLAADGKPLPPDFVAKTQAELEACLEILANGEEE